MPTVPDQIIDVDLARGLQADAARQTDLLAWIVTLAPHEHRMRVMARLVTSAPTPYVLLADSLGELSDALHGLQFSL
jgi:hypothetical protein